MSREEQHHIYQTRSTGVRSAVEDIAVFLIDHSLSTAISLIIGVHLGGEFEFEFEYYAKYEIGPMS